MYIKKGSSRIVVVFDELGFVIKVAKISLGFAISEIHYGSKFRKHKNFVFLRELIYDLREYDDAVFTSFRYHTTRGLLENWSEFRFWKKHKNPFCVPTYFSFFGLVNVQRFGVPLPDTLTRENVLWNKIKEFAEGAIRSSGHTWNNPDNFCRHNRKLQIFDYASKNVQKVILRKGTRIHKRFDITE